MLKKCIVGINFSYKMYDKDDMTLYALKQPLLDEPDEEFEAHVIANNKLQNELQYTVLILE